MTAPKLFEVGDVVRFAVGRTALMQIRSISAPHGNSAARYYGDHCLGDRAAASHENCKAADDADLRTWARFVDYRARI